MGMEKLKLNFLSEAGVAKRLDPIEEVLRELGEEICEYAKGYFYFIVSTTSRYDAIEGASLYIIVPEIGYDYKVLTLAYKDAENVTVHFFTLRTKQTEALEVSITQGWEGVREKVSQLLSSPVANTTFKFLTDQVDMKRQGGEEEEEEE